VTIILFRYNFEVVINTLDEFSDILYVLCKSVNHCQFTGTRSKVTVSAQWTEVENLFIAYKDYVGIYFYSKERSHKTVVLLLE
jgi:hypothetical protein